MPTTGDLTLSDIDAVVFDIGGVFLVPSPHRIAEVVAPVDVEIDTSDEAAHRAHYTGVRALTDVLSSGIDEADPSIWYSYDVAWFRCVGVDGDALDRAVSARASYRERRNKVGHVWTHALGANIAAFAGIAAGCPVAVVSNNDGTAAEQCADHGICQVGAGPHTEVAALVDSGVVGVAKPDPRIFEPALAALATDPGRTLYVGDTVHADVHGADAAGMPVVQLDPYDLHDDHGHWRLPDVAAIHDLLS